MRAKMLVALLVSTVVLYQVACAADLPSTAASRGWEASFRIGPGFTADSLTGFSNQDRVPYNFEYAAGIASSVALGYRFSPHWRIEIEMSRRDNELAATSTPGSSSGHFDTTSILANVYYDFFANRRWTPYLGAGIGHSWVDLDSFKINGQSLINDTSTALGFQGIGGVLFRIDERWTATFDYRYLRTTDPKVVNASGEFMDTSVRNHALLLGLTRNFGN